VVEFFLPNQQKSATFAPVFNEVVATAAGGRATPPLIHLKVTVLIQTCLINMQSYVSLSMFG
jgi:hypothetical protein